MEYCLINRLSCAYYLLHRIESKSDTFNRYNFQHLTNVSWHGVI